jgi:hypothetical protein
MKSASPHKKGRKNQMSVIRMGSPAIPVKVTKSGTYIAKLAHIWRTARRSAEQRGYKVMEGYGVLGVAPFLKKTVAAWLGYLQVPCREPIHFYEIIDNRFSWVAEWSSG